MLLAHKGINIDCQMPQVNDTYNSNEWKNYANSLNSNTYNPGAVPTSSSEQTLAQATPLVSDLMSKASEVSEGFKVFQKCLTDEILKRNSNANLSEIEKIVHVEW